MIFDDHFHQIIVFSLFKKMFDKVQTGIPFNIKVLRSFQPISKYPIYLWKW